MSQVLIGPRVGKTLILAGFPSASDDRLAVGAHHGSADCERAEIAVGGKPNANFVAQRETRVTA